jgi:hypothetical protein
MFSTRILFLSSTYHVFNAWGWSIRRKHVAYFDGTNKIRCGGRLCTYKFLIYCTITGWILKKKACCRIVSDCINLPLREYTYKFVTRGETIGLDLIFSKNFRKANVELLNIQSSKVKKEPTRWHKSWSLFIFINSTCFGHHYAHLQENKTIAAYGVLVAVGDAVLSWDTDRVFFSWRWA